MKTDPTDGAEEAAGTRAEATERATDEAQAEAKAPGEVGARAAVAKLAEVETTARTKAQVVEYLTARQLTTSKKSRRKDGIQHKKQLELLRRSTTKRKDPLRTGTRIKQEQAGINFKITPV